MITFSPARFDERALSEYGALFAACFPASDKFTPAYLRWLYRDNPDGQVVGFDAWEGEQLAAHYVCIPARATVNGEPQRVLLSLNTATHPLHQGKGLFIKLATMTYEAGTASHFSGVYGVANGNSTPGFVRKLGFQLVRQLEARVGLGCLTAGQQAAQRPLAFERIWNQESLNWRCANPVNQIRARRKGELWQFQAPALGRLLPAYAELNQGTEELHLPGSSIPPLRLFIGLLPERSGNFRTYASIPHRLRPSPLNLIYRPLSAAAQRLDPGAINFSFLDFDAY